MPPTKIGFCPENVLPRLQPISPSELASVLHISHAGASVAQRSTRLVCNSSLQHDSPSSTSKGLSRNLVFDPSTIVPQANTSTSMSRKQRRKAGSLLAASGDVGLLNSPSAPLNAHIILSESPEKRDSDPPKPLTSPRLYLMMSTPRKLEELAAGPPRSREEEARKNKSFTFLSGNLLRQLGEPTASASTGTIPIANDERNFSRQPSVPYFFTWSPPLKVDENAKIPGSGGTRSPGFWDMHLHEKFILKKVVSAPSLATLLGEVADAALKQVQATSPNPATIYQVTKERLMKNYIFHTDDELEVQNFYGSSIAPFCLAMVHAFGSETPLEHFLAWTFKRRGQAKAKADGFLTINDSATQSLAFPDEFKNHLKLLKDWNLDILAVWEFKSLAAGSKDVMDAIQRLGSQKSFAWTSCTPLNLCKSKSTNHPDTGRRTGPDANPSLGILPQPDTRKRSRGVMSGLDDMVDHPPNDEDDEISYDEDTFPEIFDDETSGNNMPKDRGHMRGNDRVNCESCFATDDRIAQVILESKKAQQSSTNGTQVLTKANHIAQQVWAEAMQCDATFLVINAGLYEFIGFRHRATQTLYLSDMIRVSKSAPAYGKLHTGLYLAAFNDALNRAMQLEHARTSGERYNYLYRRKYLHDKVTYMHEDENDINSQKQEELSITREGTNLLMTMGETLERSFKMQVHSPQKIPIFGGDKVQVFYRLNDIGELPDSEPDTPNNLHLFLEPLAGSVYTCAVLLDEEVIADRFVMKLAQQQDDRESLLREYKTYLALKEGSFKGIVKVYGLFQCNSQGMRGMGLVMSHGGRSLLHSTDWKARVRRKAVCEQFEAIMKELKLNEIVHRGLLLEHFVLNKSKGLDGRETSSLSLVSWKSAKRLPPQPVVALPEAARMEVSHRLAVAERTHREGVMTSKREAWRAWEAESEGAIEGIRRFLTT